MWNRIATISRTICTDFPSSGYIEEYNVRHNNINAKVHMNYEDYQKIILFYNSIEKEWDIDRFDFEQALTRTYGKNFETELNIPPYDEYYVTRTIGATTFLFFSASTGTADVFLTAQTNGDCYLYISGNVLS